MESQLKCSQMIVFSSIDYSSLKVLRFRVQEPYVKIIPGIPMLH